MNTTKLPERDWADEKAKKLVDDMMHKCPEELADKDDAISEWISARVAAALRTAKAEGREEALREHDIGKILDAGDFRLYGLSLSQIRRLIVFYADRTGDFKFAKLEDGGK